ncbi:MAG: type II toxin-antitoxin system Phd/YefM family antitoxin [Ilumatobacteraceae bacterium]
MYTLGVRDLRRDLAAVLRRARHGESTIVSDRGQPIAVIRPIDTDSPGMEQLLASSAVNAPRRLGAWRPLSPVRVWSGTRIDQALRELRG